MRPRRGADAGGPPGAGGLFGIGSSMLLMADHDLKPLFVVAHHGYASGVGAEIAVGDGVIGVAAQRRRQVLVSHVTRAQALYRAAARSRTEERHEIPLPGLAGAQSLVATSQAKPAAGEDSGPANAAPIV